MVFAMTGSPDYLTRPDPPAGRGVDLIQRKTVPGTDRDLGTALQDSGSADSGLWIGLLADMDSGSGTGFWAGADSGPKCENPSG